MATNFEWFERKVSSLANNEDRAQSLSEIKLALSTLNPSDHRFIAHNLPLDGVFDCLNTSERAEIELACQVLAIFLSSLDPGTVIGQYDRALQRALGHPSVEVKTLAIAELQRAADDASLVPQLCQSDFLLTTVDCICQDDLALAKCASSLLLKLGKTSVGLKYIYTGEILEGLVNAKKQSDVICFRVYEVVVAISEHSPAGLQASISCGMLPDLINEFKTDDVLLQLNTLECLTKLALCPHGLQYLQHKGVIQNLVNKVESAEGEVEGTILLPGLMKFFGNVAQSMPKEFFAQYPAMITTLFTTLNDPDLTIVRVTMETIGYIATTVEGKHMLSSLGSVMNNAMKTLSEKIGNSPTEWRVCALNTVANIIELKVPDQNTQTLAITKSWFDEMSANPLDIIMSVCQQPFPELKLGGLQVLQALSEQAWGQEYLNKYPGLVEFLLDRSTESNKACKDAKYEVIRTIIESPTASTVFNTNTLLRFKAFVREGPCYVHTQTEVAIEGAS